MEATMWQSPRDWLWVGIVFAALLLGGAWVEWRLRAMEKRIKEGNRG